VAESILPDPSTPFGERVERHLRDDVVVWLTTVGRDGTPQPNPVWFLWTGEHVLVQNLAEAARVAHIRSRPNVSLNFAGNGRGGDIVVVTGRAEILDEPLTPADAAAYDAKYAEHIRRLGSPDLASFVAAYPVLIRITPTRVRGF
jgi:PPOX class probable F420-dependent enzyme